MNTSTSRHPRNQTGALIVEYALLIALIAVVVIAAWTALARQPSTEKDLESYLGKPVTLDEARHVATYSDTVLLENGKDIVATCKETYSERQGELAARLSGDATCYDENGKQVP